LTDNRPVSIKERERLRKRHEQAVADEFVGWIAERGGPVFSFDHSETHPDLVYKSGELTLNVEHTSAQYDEDHRRLIDTPVLGSRYPVEVWPPYDFQEGTELKNVSRIGEELANSVVEQILKKCQKARDHRFKNDPILLVEVLPGMTTAEDLSHLLSQKQIPSDCLFAGVYVVGRFPLTSKSVGGFRVLPIKECDLTLALPKKHDQDLSTQMSEAEADALLTEGYEKATAERLKKALADL
jgi:hypothetical protein